MLVHQMRPVRRHLRPFGGKHLGMKMAAETAGAVPRRKRLHKPGRGILGDAGKWAEPSKEEARASHVIGLKRPARQREADFERRRA